MTWKERRNIQILLIIAAALFFALLVVFGMLYRQGREEVLAGTAGGMAETGAPSDPGDYSAVSYYNGSATLSFSLDEKGNWIWSDGPEFPLKDDTVTSVLSKLSSLKFQQVLPATQSKEEYGFDAPSATLSAVSGETAQTLTFGKTTTDGDSYYMMMNGDESTVYIVAGDLVKEMQTPIYDMCDLPQLPDFSEVNLRAITVQGPAPEAAEDGGEGGEGNGEPAEAPERPAVSLTARRSDGDGKPALWFSGNDNVTANALFQDLLYDLRTMYVAKCVDYRPSDEAAEICGFANPAAILKVEYAAGGTDQTYTLNVGARMPDESGRYVQLDGDTTVYAMSSDCVDALMSVSVGAPGAAAQTGGEE